jgi:hypothetical protein
MEIELIFYDDESRLLGAEKSIFLSARKNRPVRGDFSFIVSCQNLFVIKEML